MKKIISLSLAIIIVLSGMVTIAKTDSNYSKSCLLDDIPPEIEIITPRIGYLYFHLMEKQFKIFFNPPLFTLILGKIDIEINATDDSGIEWVQVYINDEFKTTLPQAPYIWSWDERNELFPYTIKVVASDLSGNQNETEITVWKIQFLD
jgi:hypothetical protein